MPFYPYIQDILQIAINIIKINRIIIDSFKNFSDYIITNVVYKD